MNKNDKVQPMPDGIEFCNHPEPVTIANPGVDLTSHSLILSAPGTCFSGVEKTKKLFFIPVYKRIEQPAVLLTTNTEENISCNRKSCIYHSQNPNNKDTANKI
jgi:hypothetical protein